MSRPAQVAAPLSGECSTDYIVERHTPPATATPDSASLAWEGFWRELFRLRFVIQERRAGNEEKAAE